MKVLVTAEYGISRELKNLPYKPHILVA